MRKCNPRWLALIALLACALAMGQQPGGVDYPVAPPEGIKLEHLRPGPDGKSATLEVRNESSTPRQVVIPAGTAFAAPGVQTVMVLQSASASVPARESSAIPLEVICAEAEQPAPTAGSRLSWAARTPVLSEKFVYLQAVRDGVGRVDGEVVALARSVRIRGTGAAREIEYSGEPLSAVNGHLLRAADWSGDEPAPARGILNRSVVVQFAFWALTDNYTDDDLRRRLHEPRFGGAQAREAALAAAVHHLLARSGVKPAIFDAASPESAFNRAVAAEQAGRAPEAEGLYRVALERRPAHAAAALNLGLLLAKRSRSDEARGVWQAARIHFPNDADLTYNLGTLAYRTGDRDRAAALFAAARNANPTHPLAAVWAARLGGP